MQTVAKPQREVEQLWPNLPAEDKLTTRKFGMLRSALRTFRLEKEKLLKGKNPPPVTKATIFIAKEYLDWQQTCLKVLALGLQYETKLKLNCVLELN